MAAASSGKMKTPNLRSLASFRGAGIGTMHNRVIEIAGYDHKPQTAAIVPPAWRSAQNSSLLAPTVIILPGSADYSIPAASVLSLENLLDGLRTNTAHTDLYRTVLNYAG